MSPGTKFALIDRLDRAIQVNTVREYRIIRAKLRDETN
jgi:hypothetical protein